MKKIDMKGIQEYIKVTSERIYEVISQLEDIMLRGRYYENDEYQIESSESIELEDYLNSYIESIHVCICLMMEHYELENLYNEYLAQYKKYSNTDIKYYSEVDVFDSPVWGMMCNYVKALSFFNEEGESGQNFLFHADLSNKVENKNIVSIEINEIIEKTKDILDSLDSLNIEDEAFKKLCEEVGTVVSMQTPQKNKIKNSLNKVYTFLLNNSVEIIKDDMKLRLPFVMKQIGDLISSIIN